MNILPYRVDGSVCRAIVNDNHLELSIRQCLTAQARQRRQHEITAVIGTQNNAQSGRNPRLNPFSILLLNSHTLLHVLRYPKISCQQMRIEPIAETSCATILASAAPVI